MILKEIAKTIKMHKTIAILPHISPDGDCIGSSFALAHALKKIGKQTSVILEDDIPKVLSFLPGDYVKVNEVGNNKVFDIAICIDSGDEKRINKRNDILKNAGITINIDHHITNTEYAEYNYIDGNASCVGEIIYDLINIMEIPVDNLIAVNIYTAIITDTGGFRYSNTTERTHIITAELLKYGINIEEVNRIVFGTQTLVQLKLSAKVIESIELYKEGKIAIATILYDTMKNIGAIEEDADGLSNLPRTIEGVEIGILLRETEDGSIKVNFRSNRYADVSKIAKLFGGGGHKKASGCTIDLNIGMAKKKLIDAASNLV